MWLGGVATKNEQVANLIRLVRQELQGLAQGRVEEQELTDAKTYLTGSFALRLTSNDQVAKTLVSMLDVGLGRDYLERRNALIEAVTLDDVRRVAAQLYGVEPLFAIAGAPEGESTHVTRWPPAGLAEAPRRMMDPTASCSGTCVGSTSGPSGWRGGSTADGAHRQARGAGRWSARRRRGPVGPVGPPRRADAAGRAPPGAA